MSKIVDFAIIGQGLAGTLVSHLIAKKTNNYLVIDAESHTASFAAAGIINPVTGQKYVKSWMIDDLLQSSIQTYTELETMCRIKCVRQANILRSLNSVGEENDWLARAQDPLYKSYLLLKADLEKLANHLNLSNSYGEITNAYQIDISRLILAYRTMLKEAGKYLQLEIDYHSINYDEACIAIDDNIKAEKVIFCDGYKSKENPIFTNVDFCPVKGNAMIIETDFSFEKILRQELFVAPLGNNQFWVGSFYQFEFEGETIDDTEQLRLEKILDKLIKRKYKIIKRMAGIRPAVKKRRPVIGQHPYFKNVYIFNGLGTKGASIGPYFANMLVESIFEGKEIMREVSLKNYFQ